MLVCLLGIDSLCNFSLLCDPLLLTWHDARGNGCGLKWRQVRAQTPTFRHPRPLESLWYVITDIDCLLSWTNSPHPPHNPVAAWTLHGCNWMLQSCSGAVKTALWPDITDKWSLMLGWTECVCRCSVASCFVVVEVSFLISLDWFSQLRMNIGTTEAFFGRVCQQTPAGEKHQQCWAFIRKKTQLTWLFLFRPDLCWSSSAHQTLSFFFFFFFILQKAFIHPMSLPVSVFLRSVFSPFYGHCHQLVNSSARLYSAAVWPRMVRLHYGGIHLWKITAARKKMPRESM